MTNKPIKVLVSSARHSGQAHLTAFIVEALREKGLTGKVLHQDDTLTITVNGLTETNVEAIRSEQVKHRLVHITSHTETEF